MSDHARQWVLDIVGGGLVGGFIGGIVAVNVVIWAGPDDGYESSIPEVFRHNVLTGIITVTALVAGPVVGVAVARRSRKV